MPPTSHRLFPATVTLPDGTTLHKVLVHADLEAVSVYARRSDHEGEDTRTDSIVRVASFAGSVRSDGQDRWLFGPEDAPVLMIKGSGCGCGNVLRGFQP